MHVHAPYMHLFPLGRYIEPNIFESRHRRASERTLSFWARLNNAIVDTADNDDLT